MNNTPSRILGVGSLLAGILLCIAGAGVLLLFGSLLLGFAFWQGSSAVAKTIFFVLTGCGAFLLYKGVQRCDLYGFAQRVQAVMAGKNRETLAVLCQHTRRGTTRLVRDLRALSARGYFPRAYVDLYRREFVTAPGSPAPPVAPGPTLLREVSRRSVVPVYLVAAIWLLWALVLPLYRWYDFALVAAVSLAVYLVAGRMLPNRTVILEETRKVEPPRKPEPIRTGNSELDEVLTTAMGYMNELTALDVAITNGRIDKPVQELVHICKQIFDYIKKTPEKVRQIRQFMNYYLPTTIKLLKNYDELSREPLKGENIHKAMTKIEDTMQTIVAAFQKELDNLYQDKALDIEVDIEVLQNMMEQEGLTGTPPHPGASSGGKKDDSE